MTEKALRRGLWLLSSPVLIERVVTWWQAQPHRECYSGASAVWTRFKQSNV